MADPRLLRGVGAVVLVGAACLVGWWAMLPPEAQRARLLQVRQVEGIAPLPPVSVWEQPDWLVTHRLTRLQGMTVLLVLGGMLGVAEGIALRQRALYGGFLLRLWTLGVVALLGSVAAAGVFLIAPWPLGSLGAPCALAGLVTLAAFGLGAGRPLIP